MGCILTPPLRILAVMVQSLARILVHAVFSTKASWIDDREGKDRCNPFQG